MPGAVACGSDTNEFIRADSHPACHEAEY